LASGGLMGMPGVPPASTNCPAGSVPPVPSTESVAVQGGVLGLEGTSARQIWMQVFGACRGSPVPVISVPPTSTPPVITGPPGVGVGLTVAVALGVCVSVTVGVRVGVPVGVAVGVRVGVAVVVCVGVAVGVSVGEAVDV
jgi:hypothetical protein